MVIHHLGELRPHPVERLTNLVNRLTDVVRNAVFLQFFTVFVTSSQER